MKKHLLKFGDAFKSYAKQHKLILLYGIEKEWVHEMFFSDPSTRSLWFQLQWFCEAEEIASDYTNLVREGAGSLYTNQFYQVDSIVTYEGVGGYLDLLDSIASSLEDKGHEVKKVIFEQCQFKPNPTRDLGFDPFYAKPKSIEFFRSLDTGSFVELDSLDESLITLPFRKQAKAHDNT